MPTHRHSRAQQLTVRLGDLHEAVAEALELATRALADVGRQAGTSEVQWVDEAEGGGTGGSTAGQVAGEELPELLLLVHSLDEQLLVGVLEGEVERLGWEVSDHVGQVACNLRAD